MVATSPLRFLVVLAVLASPSSGEEPTTRDLVAEREEESAGHAAQDPQPDTASVLPGKRRTLRGYGSNLLYNFLGVVTTGNHEPLLVTAALTLPAFAWDDEAKQYFAQNPQQDFGRIGARMGGAVAVSGLTIGFFSAAHISHGERFQASTYDVSQAVIVNQLWTQALKFSIRRTRPDESDRLSFPSGHASNAFAAATVIGRHYPKLAAPGYAVATFIAISRLAANKHHFSDTVAGAGFGYGVGRLVVRRNSRAPDNAPPAGASMSAMPDSGPAGDGVGVRFAVIF